ncbi:hypothetical protein PVL29_024394 [Vitis rotundifolia]|uniref:ABC1 atypical kinase-like domain-containing protein n=1 Tax=Vitis rotundifolia TaxID=103349 RepID=A0AA38YRR1_VITRO|nr:hypothetical protein PVL29_024394 [Vitis rotundifolia]
MLLLPAAPLVPPAPPLSASKLWKGKPYAIQLNGFNRKVSLPVRLRRTVVCGISGDVDTFTQYSGYLFNLSSSEADSLTEYDVSRIGAIYRNRPLVLIRRLFQIATTLGKWLGLRYIDGLMERSDQMFEVRAAELRKILVELGPAYVKIAQAISSRPDLIPPSYLDQLSLLQDRITPFSNEVAFNTIERELGLPIDKLFSEISPEPVAAASLGQVYQARLRPSGQVVAVKVQRPGVQAAISLDILILRFLAGLVRRAGKLNTDLQAVLDEWASSLFKEMDYRKEAKNGIKFRQLYGGIKDVFVPEMYLERTTHRVLIMEWVEGQKLSEVKDLYLIEVGVYSSFNQLLEHGFYHADPHPGNLLRTNDRKLAYLGVFQMAVAKGVRNISFGDLLGNLGSTMYKFKFRIPSYFSLVIRSLAVLEGIAIGFNQDYKVLGSTYPWIARKVLTDSSPKLKSSLQALLYKEGVFRIDRLESLLSESLRARTERALVTKQMQGTDSRLVVKQILSFTLTEKGLDALGLATLDSITSVTATSLPFSASRPFSSMTDDDINNLRTLRRLLLLLSGPQKTESSSKGVKDSEEMSLVFNQLASVQEILPILSIIPELPPELQQQLLLLPSNLAGRLMSRVAARMIRRIFL